MERLDDDLEVEASRRALRWRFQGQDLARVERKARGLVASVAPENEELGLESERDVELFLEGAMGRLVQIFGVRATEEPAPAREAPEEPLNLLSPEEIEAFRQ
jgi:hypothetical protein